MKKPRPPVDEFQTRLLAERDFVPTVETSAARPQAQARAVGVLAPPKGGPRATHPGLALVKAIWEEHERVLHDRHYAVHMALLKASQK